MSITSCREDKLTRYSRSVGCKYSREDYEEGMTRMKVYEDWFLKEILMSGKESVLLVSQSETVAPLYRDDPPA